MMSKIVNTIAKLFQFKEIKYFANIFFGGNLLISITVYYFKIIATRAIININ